MNTSTRKVVVRFLCFVAMKVIAHSRLLLIWQQTFVLIPHISMVCEDKRDNRSYCSYFLFCTRDQRVNRFSRGISALINQRHPPSTHTMNPLALLKPELLRTAAGVNILQIGLPGINHIRAMIMTNPLQWCHVSVRSFPLTSNSTACSAVNLY